MPYELCAASLAVDAAYVAVDHWHQAATCLLWALGTISSLIYILCLHERVPSVLSSDTLHQLCSPSSVPSYVVLPPVPLSDIHQWSMPV